MDKTLVFGGVGLLLTLAVVFVATRPAAQAPPLAAAPEPGALPGGQLSDSTGDTLRGVGQLLNGLGGGFVNVFGEVRRQDRADATSARAEDRADRTLALQEANAARGQTGNGATGRGT